MKTESPAVPFPHSQRCLRLFHLLLAAILGVGGMSWVGAGEPASSPTTVDIYNGKTVAEWVEQLKDGDKYKRSDAAVALRDLGPKAKSAVQALIAALDDDNKYVALISMQALGGIGQDAQSAVVRIVEFIGDPEKQAAAAETLGKIGLADNDALYTLITALKKEKDDPDFRREAAFAIARMAPENKDVVRALIDLTKDKRVGVSAVYALAACGEHAAPAVPALKAFLKRCPEELPAIMEILGKIGPPAKELLPKIIPIIEAKSDAERCTLIGYLSAIGLEESIELFQKQSDNEPAKAGQMRVWISDLERVKNNLAVLGKALAENDATFLEQTVSWKQINERSFAYQPKQPLAFLIAEIGLPSVVSKGVLDYWETPGVIRADAKNKVLSVEVKNGRVVKASFEDEEIGIGGPVRQSPAQAAQAAEDIAWGQPADAYLYAPPGPEAVPDGWGEAAGSLKVGLVVLPATLQPKEELVFLQLHVQNNSGKNMRVPKWDEQMDALIVTDVIGKVMPARDDDRSDGVLREGDFETILAEQTSVLTGWSGSLHDGEFAIGSRARRRAWTLPPGEYTLRASFIAANVKDGVVLPPQPPHATSKPVKITVLDKPLVQPANRVQVGLATANKAFRVGEPVKLTLHVKNANPDLKVSEGTIELRPEGGEFGLMCTCGIPKLLRGQPGQGDQTWELVIPSDAETNVWERNPTSQMMHAPIKGLSAGKYRVAWFTCYCVVDNKYKTGQLEVEIVDKP